MKPDLLQDKEAFIELPIGMDFRAPWQRGPFHKYGDEEGIMSFDEYAVLIRSQRSKELAASET